MAQVKIEENTFFNHHKNLKKKIEDQNKFDAIFILNGKDDPKKIKTVAISVWYFGYDFIDTILVLTKNKLILVASEKKIIMTENLKKHPDYKNYKIELIKKDNKDEQQLFDELIQNIKTDVGKSGELKIGTIQGEEQIGKFASSIQESIKKNKDLKIGDCSNLIEEVLQKKDQNELEKVRLAGKICCYLEKKLIERIEKYIESGEKVTHSDISNHIQKILETQNEVNKIEKRYKVDTGCLDFTHNPIIQSGGKYNFFTEDNDKEQLVSDGIATRMTISCFGYHCSIARNQYISHNNKACEDVYQKIIELQKLIFTNLKVGAVIGKVYDLAVEFIQKELSQFKIENQVPESFGHGIGLELTENQLNIRKGNQEIVQVGNVFCIKLAFKEIPAEDKKINVNLIDTIIIEENGIECITDEVEREYQDICYTLSESEESEVEEKQKKGGNSKQKSEKKQNNNPEDDFKKVYSTRNRRNPNQQKDMGKEKERKEHQKKLAELKIQDMKNRLNNEGFTSNSRGTQNIEVKDLKCISDESSLNQYTPGQINIDNKKYCLLLPIFGQLVPFHIALIKNAQKNEDGEIKGIRINFNFPTNKLAVQGLTFPELRGIEWAYVKELIFRNKSSDKIDKYVKDINELKKKFKMSSSNTRNEEEKEQEKLELVNGKRPILKDLYCRPALSTKKCAGILECHKNGFRYQTNKGEKVEIIFKNIKNAFFQSCEHEMIAAINFNLHQEILIGKKKTFDIQFFIEVGQNFMDLNDKRNYDDDDDEELEQAQRKKINKDFKAFIAAVEEVVNDSDRGITIQFEKPYRKLGFYGSPLRSNVYLQPTLNCLINILETPFFVMNLKEVELACFERMISGLKNFDLVFVFKDYDKPVQRITAIPIEHSEQIRDWLDKMDILFFDCTKPLSWPVILGEIKKDIEGFIEDGGWKHVLDESESELGQEESEESNFSEEINESEDEDSEDEDSDFGDEEDESDFDGEEEDDDDEEISEEDLEEESEPPRKKGGNARKR